MNPEPAPSTHLAFLPKIYLNVMLTITPSVSPVHSARHVTQMATFILHVLTDDLQQ